MAKKTFHNTVLYNKSVNLNFLEDIAGLKSRMQVKFIWLSIRIPFLLVGLNEILMLPGLEQGIHQRLVMFIEIIQRWLQYSCGIGDYPTFVAETLAIREAVIAIILKQMSNVIIESDSLIAIQTIRWDIKPSTQILNLIEDIIVLIKAVKNVIFVY